jgi:hypothetical protein
MAPPLRTSFEPKRLVFMSWETILNGSIIASKTLFELPRASRRSLRVVVLHQNITALFSGTSAGNWLLEFALTRDLDSDFAMADFDINSLHIYDIFLLPLPDIDKERQVRKISRITQPSAAPAQFTDGVHRFIITLSGKRIRRHYSLINMQWIRKTM